MNPFNQKICNHVAKDNLAGAVELLITHFDAESSSNLIDALLISWELYSIMKAINTGIITWEEGNRMKKKLALNILLLIGYNCNNYEVKTCPA